MADPSQLSDDELFRIAGIQPPAGQPQAAPQQSRTRQPVQSFSGNPRDTILGVAPGAAITSGRRTPERQRELIAEWERGGRRGVRPANNSYHLRGQAFDLTPAPGQSMAQLEAQLRQSGLPFQELINEGDHVHVAWNGEPEGEAATVQPAMATDVSSMSDDQLMAMAGGDAAPSGQGGRASIQDVLARPWLAREPVRMIEQRAPEYDDQGREVVIVDFGIRNHGDGTWSVPERMADGTTAIYRLNEDEYLRWRGLRDQRDRVSREEASEGQRAAEERAREIGVGEADFISSLGPRVLDEVGWGSGYLLQGVENLRRRVTGQEIESSALEGARAYRAVTQDNQERFDRERPLQAATAGVLGGFLFAPGRGASAVGLGGRLGQAGAIGGAYGAAEGDGLGQRAGNAALGGALGVGTAGVLESLPVYARSLTRDVNNLRGANASNLTPDETRVSRILERALERDNIDPRQMIAAAQADPQGVPALMGGRNVAALGEAAVSVPGAAQTRIARVLEDRAGAATDRVSQELGQAFGATGGGLRGIEEGVSARSSQASQAMSQIEGLPIALSADAQAAIRAPRARAAILDAADNRLSSVDPQTRQQGVRLQALLDGGASDAGSMTIRDVQDISYALREAASSAFESGDGAKGTALRELAGAIRQSGRDASPEYRSFLQDFGDASANLDAQRLGMSVFNKASERNRVSAAQLRSQVDDMTPSEIENFRLGVGEALIDRARSVQGGVGAMRALARSDEYADRVRVAFPTEEAFENFLSFATREVDEANTINRILGSSRTASRQGIMDDLNRDSGLDAREVYDLGRNALTLNAPGFLSSAANSVLRRIPNTRANVIQGERTNPILGEALSDSPAVQRLLEDMERRRILEELVQNRSSGVRALSTPGVSGAIATSQF